LKSVAQITQKTGISLRIDVPAVKLDDSACTEPVEAKAENRQLRKF